MTVVLLVIHLILCVALIGIVLIQRSEGGGLGIGGGGMGAFMGARGTANLMTRTTAILAGAFFLTTLLLTLLHGRPIAAKSAMENVAPAAVETEAPAPVSAPVAGKDETAPAKPAETPKAPTTSEPAAAPAAPSDTKPAAPAEAPATTPSEPAPAETPAESPAKP